MSEPGRTSRRVALKALGCAAIGAACGPDPRPVPFTEPLDDTAERYVRLALELAAHQPSLIEDWWGPDSWRPPPRRPVATLHSEIVELAGSVARSSPASGPGVRWRYLRGQTTALEVAARRLLGESMSFAGETAAAFGAEAAALLGDAIAPPAQVAYRAARAQLDEVLPRGSSLQDRLRAFRARHAVAGDTLLRTFDAAVVVCGRQLAAVTQPVDLGTVHVEKGPNLGLAAQARYRGQGRTTITLDGAFQPDLASLVWLAAHEGFPGHHWQHLLGEEQRRQTGWHERALAPLFGPHLLASEGAAEAGAEWLLAGSVFEECCSELAGTAHSSQSVLGPLVATHRAVTTLDLIVAHVAQAWLDGAIRSDEALERLETEALVADPPALLHLIERRRSRALAYPVGRRLVGARIEEVAPSSRAGRLREIATTLVFSL